MMEEAGSFGEIWKQFAENLARGWSWSGFERSVMFVNDGTGHFTDIGMVTGLDQVTDGRGVAVGDIDNDGDLDMVATVSRLTPQVYVLRNDLRSDRHHLYLELRGSENKLATGAKVLLTAGGKTQRRDVALGYGYRSQAAMALHFGIGDATRVERVEITWPDGELQVLEDLEPDRRLILYQGQTEPRVVEHVQRNFNATYKLNPTEWHEHWNRMRLLKPPFVNLADVGMSDLVTGEPIRLGPRGWKGPTLVNFWATWCANCAREMPELVQAHQDSEVSGLRIVGIGMDEGDATAKVRETVKNWGMRFPVAYPPEAERTKLLEALVPVLGEDPNLPLPTSLLLDRQGNVRGIVQGTVSVEQVHHYLKYAMGR